jgi:TetR/AcrR family transcriptional regulator, transcriptional repressor for nem operon
MRVSKEKAAESRERILEAASRLFRERGIDAAGVDDVTRAAGLTHGGFYGHFDSKEALAAEAVERAMAASAKRWRKLLRGAPAEEALTALLTGYLSSQHRDARGRGCPLSALCSEVGRQPESVRRSFTKGLMEMLNVLEELLPDEEPVNRRSRAILTLAALVGAITMARAVENAKLSNLILTTVLNELEILLSTKNQNQLSREPSRRRSHRRNPD